jgi:Na+/H+ antiporter NhaD/arsenite permease-like protein
MPMMTTLLVTVFVLGYLAITLEHTIKINKAASALIAGVLCWTIYVLNVVDTHSVVHALEVHMGELSGILFFLLGAMVVVELIDAHDGFEIITARIRTKSKPQLLWVLSLVTFFLSAVLDNLTTTIVIVSLIRKLIDDREDRLLFAGMTVVAANAGGAWSPMGDVTTTMLWIGGQISVTPTIINLFLPSFVCLCAPLIVLSFRLRGEISSPVRSFQGAITSTDFERKAVFAIGLLVLLAVPVFKTVTHLPP